MDFSIIFPAYNEENNIVETIKQFNQELVSYTYEIIVVDDGSTDKTANRVSDLQLIVPNLQLVQHVSNKGYGAALRSGFSHAQSPWCFFTDSDLQFHPRDFHRLWSHKNNYDVIIGYRSPRKDPLFRRFNAKMWGFYIRNLLGVDVRDLNCAFKLFRRDLLNNVQLQSDGAFINAELLAQICRTDISVYEVPVSHYTRKTGTQSGANLSVIVLAFQESFNFHQRLR
jgi:glycosyltransferase involved in cell wall biosynthesis